MRRLLLLLSLMIPLISARAVTISGTLSNQTIVTAVSGHKVYLIDSSFTTSAVTRDSTVSSSTGTFSFTLPSTATSGRVLVYVIACGVQDTTMVYSPTSASLNANLLICPYNYSSSVVYDTIRNSVTNAPVWGQKVYIVDSSAASVRRDSAYTNRNGVVQLRVMPMLSSGNLRIYTNDPCGATSQTVSFTGSMLFAPTMYVCNSSPQITGTLTNTSTSTAVPFYKVVFSDSFGGVRYYADSVWTNSSGSYSGLFPVSTPGHTISVSATACGSRHVNSTTYSGGSVTLNLGICATSIATISGVVTDGMLGVSGQKIYLYDTMGTTVYVDSTVTSVGGSYSFTVPARRTSGVFTLWSTSCGAHQMLRTVFYAGVNQVQNLIVYPGVPATFSGKVVFLNGSPASGLAIAVQRSGTTTRAYGVTAANGTYSISLPCSWPRSGTLQFITDSVSCRAPAVPAVAYSGANIVYNDTLCPVVMFSLSGIVTKQGGGAAAGAKVWIIEQRHDSLSGVTTLIAYDSTTTNASGRYFVTTPTVNYLNNSYGSLRGFHVKAALNPSDPAYSNFLPTYRDTVLNWNSGYLSHWYDWYVHPTNLNVILRSGTNPGGPGFIGGDVLLGANKSTGAGDPLSGRILILTDLAGKPVAYTHSDAAGSFSFPSLPYGSYYLFGDAGGRANPKLQVTLSASRSRIESVVFEENSTSFDGRIENVSVSPEQAAGMLRVYPNPASGTIRIQGLAQIAGGKTLVIRNLAGAVTSSTEVAAGKEPQIEVGGFPAGVYQLEVRTESGVQHLRFVKN